MMRWVCLLLLLANALVFFWYALQQRTAQRDDYVEPEVSLKLLSEIDVRRLTPLTSEAERTHSNAECLVFTGSGQVDADGLVSFLQQQGLEVERSSEEQLLPVGTELVLPSGMEASERVKAIEAFERIDLVLQSSSDQIDAALSAGVFNDPARLALIAAWGAENGVQLVSRSVERSSLRYRLQVRLGFDQKMATKINKVVAAAYPDAKIEKKVCQGVAKVK